MPRNFREAPGQARYVLTDEAREPRIAFEDGLSVYRRPGFRGCGVFRVDQDRHR